MLALVPALYLMGAIYGAIIPGSATPDTAEKTRSILLVSGPIHYDLVLPLDDMTQKHFAPLAAKGIRLDHPAAQWLVIGWGAQHFYTQTRNATDLGLYALWRGIVGDSSVLRFDIAGALPDDLDARRLTLTDREYAALLDGVWDSLSTDADSQPITADVDGFNQTDGFFAAKGRFNIWRTCNVWIGDRLRAAGLRFGLWTPMPLSVSLSFDLYQAE
ncbi:conserved hypothetical protein [Sulfitobacter marinus]|uniref:TIGR02117 family protein n=1 Tax=Sulfitobacter marinus TaxID=394264 RepID=A0A1I6TGR5_9RHOB|nr:TIGR02117 family protein [Sulfitobacter marinus]SFS88370.1 conserved hypothetical protein [Sulfitobacter marinus]